MPAASASGITPRGRDEPAIRFQAADPPQPLVELVCRVDLHPVDRLNHPGDLDLLVSILDTGGNGGWRRTNADARITGIAGAKFPRSAGMLSHWRPPPTCAGIPRNTPLRPVRPGRIAAHSRSTILPTPGSRGPATQRRTGQGPRPPGHPAESGARPRHGPGYQTPTRIGQPPRARRGKRGRLSA